MHGEYGHRQEYTTFGTPLSSQQLQISGRAICMVSRLLIMFSKNKLNIKSLLFASKLFSLWGSLVLKLTQMLNIFHIEVVLILIKSVKIESFQSFKNFIEYSDDCVAAMVVLHYYRQPGVAGGALSRKLRELKALSPLVESLTSELCYNVEVQQPLSGAEEEKLCWILSSPLHPGGLQKEPHLQGKHCGSLLIEIGPRLVFVVVTSLNKNVPLIKQI